MKKTLFASFCLLLSSLFSCQQKGSDFETLDVKQFAQIIARPDVQLVDVRTPAEHAEGHIKGSILINVNDSLFSEKADSLLDKQRPVALYCRSGRRSKKAATLLSRKGYKVYELGTGYLGWEKAHQ